MRVVGVVLCCALLGSCKELDPKFCDPADRDRPECALGPDSGNGGCKVASDCASSPSHPICDTAKEVGTCVQCTADDKTQCTGTKPVCDLTTEACAACSVDEDCGAKGVCLPDGSCAAEASILHALSTAFSGGQDCSAATPCSLLDALNAATTTKNIIRLDDNGTFVAQGLSISKDVTIDARGATITRKNIASNNDGPIFTVTTGKKLTINGGKLSNATGTNGDGIRCDQASVTLSKTIIEQNNESAIDASNCTTIISQATINDNGSQNQQALRISDGAFTLVRSNVLANRGIGLDIINNTTFLIIGNVFVGNGNIANTSGGISINTTGSGRFEFNTVTRNIAKGAGAGGVSFNAQSTVVASSNIIWNNNPAVSGAKQVDGTNPFAYSFIGPVGPTGVLDGGHNDVSDPFLKSDTDAHPQATSRVKGKAFPTADLTGNVAKDIDGNARVVRGTGMGADVGAYVVPEQ